LTKERERELLDWLFEFKAVHPESITKTKKDMYVECYEREGAMSSDFSYYRDVEKSAEQNLVLWRRTGGASTGSSGSSGGGVDGIDGDGRQG
jgi:hypothetical protein